MDNQPKILTTTVGSYPAPDWFVACPSEQTRLGRQNKLRSICPKPYDWAVIASASRTSYWKRGCWITPD